MATETGAQGKGKKRRQRYLPHNKPVKRKGAYPLTPGIEGFFITCDGGREIQAAHEAISVIDTFFEELVSGKDISAKQDGGAPLKVMNKKVTFSYSDSSDSEGGDEDDTNGAQNSVDGNEENDKKAEKPADDKSGDEISDVKEEEVQPKEDTHEIAHENEQQAADENPEKTLEKPVDDEADDGKSDVKEEENQPKEDKHENEQQTEQPDENKSDKVEEPPMKKLCSDSRSGSQNKEKSVDELIEAELEELTDKNKRRFLRLESGCNGVVIIRMKTQDGEPGPKEVVQHMMESAASTRRHMSRHILRVLPVEVACYSSDEEISRAIKPIIAKHFPVESETAVKFAVLYDARANTGIDRMKIIDAVARSVPKPHKVDLKDPEKTIVVQVVKTVCLIGVVEKYKELAKYNLRQLTSAKP